MKIKNIVILTFTVIATLLLGVFAGNFTNANYIIAADNSYSSCYLFDGNLPYKSTLEAGKTTGYSSEDKIYELGDSVELSSMANEGFTIIGWQITMANQIYFYNDDTLYWIPNNLLPSLELVEGTVENFDKITINYFDDNGDGYNDRSKLTVSEVFKDMEIEPVFNFIFYKLNISQFRNDDYIVLGTEWVNGNRANYLENNEAVYYMSNENIFGINIYHDVIVKSGSNYYYYDELEFYDDLGFFFEMPRYDGSSYTVRVKIKQGDELIGKYTLNNPQVVANIKFNAQDNINISLNLSLQGLTVEKQTNMGAERKSLTKTTSYSPNSYVETKDKYGRTSSIVAYLTIQNSLDQENILAFSASKLYTVNINATLDGEGVDLNSNEYAELIINSFKDNVTAYSKIKDTQYFVLPSAKFMLTAKDITKTIDGEDYTYYTFSNYTFNSEQYNNKSFEIEGINKASTLTLNFVSKQFDVSFKFAEYSNNSLIERNGSVPEGFLIKRNETIYGANFEDKNNVGYVFVGYSASLTSDPVDKAEFTLTMDKDKPSNAVIYCCYEKIKYNLNIGDVTKISLSNASSTFYPIGQIKLSVNSDVVIINNPTEDITFASQVKIGDEVALSVTANKGFSISGFEFSNYDEIINSFLVDADLISNYSNNEEFNLELVADYVYYTLTYKTSPTSDEKIVNGINVDGQGQTLTKVDYKNETEQAESSDSVYKIVVSNLKLYQSVNVISWILSSFEGTYSFVNFKSGGVSLSYSCLNNVYTHNHTIYGDETIVVNYENKINLLTVSIADGFSEAYSVVDVQASQAGQACSYDMFDGCYTIDKSKNVDIKLKENVNTGYKFTGYTLNNGNLSSPITVAISENEFSFKLEQDGNYTLTLNFDFVKYNFKVHNRFSFEGEDVEIHEGILSLEEDKRTIKFNKIEGYYVSNVRYGYGSSLNDYYSMVQTNENKNNEYEFSTYSYTFNSENLIQLINNLKISENEVIDFVMVYSPYKYSIEFGVSVNNGLLTEFDPDSSPNVALYVYDEDLLDYVLKEEKSGDALLFEGINYLSDIKFEISNIRKGFEFDNWLINGEQGVYINQINVENLNHDIRIIYNLKLTTYNIKLYCDDTQGRLTSVVNSQELETVKIFDNVEIISSAIKSNGYMVDALYIPTACDETTWKPYYFSRNDSGVFVFSSAYEEGVRYYQRFSIASLGTTDGYVIEKFLPENYDFEGKNLTIFGTYNLIQIKVNSITKNSEINLDLDEGKETLLPSEFANYKVFKRPIGSSDEWEEVPSNGTVTFGYEIKIEGQMLTKTLKNNGIEIEYDLYKGITFSKLDIATDLYYHSEIEYSKYSGTGTPKIVWTDEGEGLYRYYFKINDAMMAVSDETHVLDVKFTYLIKKSGIKVTTNVQNSTRFYEGINLTISTSSQQYLSDGKSVVSRDVPFLTSWGAYYNLSYKTSLKNYGKYFYINSIILKVDGTEVDKEEYNYYGVFENIQVDANNNFYISGITIRSVQNIEIIFECQPIIKLKDKNGEIVTYDKTQRYEFEKTYKCDMNGVGIKQELKCGTDNSNDLIVESGIKDLMKINYYLTNSIDTIDMLNVGKYRVEILFDETGELGEVLKDMKIVIYVEIKPLKVKLFVNSTVEEMSKVYDGNDRYPSKQILKYIGISSVDSTQSNLYINKYISTTGKFVLKFEDYAKIRQTNTDISVIASSEPGQFYDLKLYNIVFNQLANFNSNFELTTNELTFSHCMQINKRQIDVFNITAENIFDKVYDGNDSAFIVDRNKVGLDLSKIVGTDDVFIDLDKVILKFINFNHPEGIVTKVSVDLSNALSGNSSRNYQVKTPQYTLSNKTIYPYSLTASMEGFGTLSLINVRAMQNPENSQYISLIPVGAKLVVEEIIEDDPTYMNIYQTTNFSSYLSNTKSYKIGFKIYVLTTSGQNLAIDKNLYLEIPTVERLSNVIFVTNDSTGLLEYNVVDNRIIIDLSQMALSVDNIMLTQEREYLKLWQIILIILIAVALIGTGVGIFIGIRIKKKKIYSLNEKI